MINGYTINKVQELYGINNYQCFLIGAIANFDEDMTVSRLLDLSKRRKIGCLATVHKAISSCIKDGFISSTPTYSDKRIKVLELTPKAKMYLSDLNKGA
jgi:DNA-binding MarR family transcriptional regulator